MSWSTANGQGLGHFLTASLRRNCRSCRSCPQPEPESPRTAERRGLAAPVSISASRLERARPSPACATAATNVRTAPGIPRRPKNPPHHAASASIRTLGRSGVLRQNRIEDTPSRAKPHPDFRRLLPLLMASDSEAELQHEPEGTAVIECVRDLTEIRGREIESRLRELR